MSKKPDARARKSSCLAWVSTQRLCHLCFGITMMLTGCRGKKKSGSRELDFLFPSCCETDVLHDLSLLVGLASCPPCPSLTEKGAGFDVCREAGRKSISTLCVLEHKPHFFFFFFPACQMHLLYICFAFSVAGPDVSLCSGFQGWLGQYYV